MEEKNSIRLTADPRSDGEWTTAWGDFKIWEGFYGACVRAEADFPASRWGETRPGVALNQSYRGGYFCQLRRKGGKSLFLLFRRGLRSVCVDWTEPEAAGIPADSAVRMSICCGPDDVTAALNGQTLLRYDRKAAGESERFDRGGCGYFLRSSEEKDRPTRFAAEGVPMPRPEAGPLPCPEPYRYTADLTGDTDGSLPGEWTDTAGAETFVLREGRITSPETGYAESLIWQFDNGTTLRAVFTAQAAWEGGSFGFLFRKAPRTAWVKAAYDFSAGRWTAEDVPALYDCESRTFTGAYRPLEPGREYTAEVSLCGSRLRLCIDGAEVLSVSGLRQTGFGKTGLFAKNARFAVCRLEAVFASGTAPLKNAFCRCVDEARFQGSMETETLNGEEILGISKQGLYYSRDGGRSFTAAPPEYKELDSRGYYQNTARLHDGSFLQILLCSGSEVRVSADLRHWTTVGRVVPEEWLDAVADQRMMSHVSAVTELRRPDGGWRLFFPMHLNTNRKDRPADPERGHDSLCFYSDDGGRTWAHSDWIGGELREHNGGEEPDWAESKVIGCADGTLRLYCSRNCSDYFSYMESRDFGKSWHGPAVIPQMQCGLSSFGVAQDPAEPGVWYVAWVNGLPQMRGDLFPRTRLSLARTRDGKNWEYLGDAERFGDRRADGALPGDRPLFQIVDPCVTVDGNAVLVSWGGSAWGSRRERTARVMNDPSTVAGTHNELRPMFAKFDKSALTPQPWMAAADLSLTSPDPAAQKW